MGFELLSLALGFDHFDNCEKKTKKINKNNNKRYNEKTATRDRTALTCSISLMHGRKSALENCDTTGGGLATPRMATLPLYHGATRCEYTRTLSLPFSLSLFSHDPHPRSFYVDHVFQLQVCCMTAPSQLVHPKGLVIHRASTHHTPPPPTSIHTPFISFVCDALSRCVH